METIGTVDVHPKKYKNMKAPLEKNSTKECAFEFYLDC